MHQHLFIHENNLNEGLGYGPTLVKVYPPYHTTYSDLWGIKGLTPQAQGPGFQATPTQLM